jgi:tRNA(Ile)-lysidine synthase
LNNSPIKQVERQIERAFPAKNWTSVRTLVAVSGGPDSVALVRAMSAIANRQLEGTTKLIVGHVNHGLRGPASDEDERFVRSLAQDLGLEYQTRAADRSLAIKPASEESLRDYRYEQLLELSRQTGARYIVTGHTFDDQVETIVFRIFRGTGVSGLAGIPQFRPATDSVTIARPLLGVQRVEILDYLRSIDQTFRIDVSNSESAYTRNFLRNELLPRLSERFGQTVPQAIVRLGEQARDVDDYLTDQAMKLILSITEQNEDLVEIDCDRLRVQPPILIRHFVSLIWIDQNWPRQAMTHQWWKEVCAAIQSDDDVVLNLPGSIRFEKTLSRVRLVIDRSRLETD